MFDFRPEHTRKVLSSLIKSDMVLEQHKLKHQLESRLFEKKREMAVMRFCCERRKNATAE